MISHYANFSGTKRTIFVAAKFTLGRFTVEEKRCSLLHHRILVTFIVRHVFKPRGKFQRASRTCQWSRDSANRTQGPRTFRGMEVVFMTTNERIENVESVLKSSAAQRSAKKEQVLIMIFSTMFLHIEHGLLL